MLKRFPRRAERGFAQAYLIAVIAMFSLTAYAMSQMYDANDQLRWSRGASDLIFDQALTIRKQIIACGTSYPDGMNNDAGALSYYKKYPATNVTLDAVTCPGAPSDQKSTWGGRDGVYLRKLPVDFSTWSYRNNSAGITVVVKGLTPRGKEVLTKVRNRFNAIEASVTGDQLTFVVAAP